MPTRSNMWKAIKVNRNNDRRKNSKLMKISTGLEFIPGMKPTRFHIFLSWRWLTRMQCLVNKSQQEVQIKNGR
jgi:hypothetical protein